MKKFKKALIIILSALIIIPVCAFLYLYLRVSNDVEITGSIPAHRNEMPVLHLDGSTLSPEKINERVKELMKAANVYGLAISVTNTNQLIYQQYFGYSNKQKNETLTPGTIFHAASFSKTILADVTLQLAEEGIINLDTPLYRYLKKPLYDYKTAGMDYSSLKNDERYKKITARMCLNHSTGFPNWRWFEDDKTLKIKFEPGQRYNYSGEGMVLLQLILEELTGKDFEQLAREKVFLPLGMDRSSFVWQRGFEGHYAVGHDTNGNSLRIPKHNLAIAAGSMSTTLEDYTIFFNKVLAQQQLRYRDLITPQIAIHSKQQFGPNSLIDVVENDSIRLTYGLGFGVYQTPFGPAFFKEGHNDGWQHYAVGFPARGTSLIMMANSENAEGIFKELIEFITGNTETPWYWEGYIPYNQR